MSAVSKGQIVAIHALKKAAALDDDGYRELLSGVAGVRSAKDLTGNGAVAVIDRLKVLSGQAPGRLEGSRKPAGALDLDGPYAGICRALWISGWHLGIVENRQDTALVAFVRRQTGIDHLNWVRDAADGNKVVEALKAWLAREGGVMWPRGQEPVARKRAIVSAQLAILGRPDDLGPSPAEANLDATMKRLGAQIRRRRADGCL